MTTGGGITLQNANPAPGSELVITELGLSPVYLSELTMSFLVRFQAAIPDAMLEVDLLSEAGEQCAFTFTNRQALPADEAVTFAIDRGFNWACALPASITTARVTLLTLRGPGTPLERTNYLVQSFPIAYAIRRYPRPPTGVPPSPPTIASLVWKTQVPACGGCAPLPGDPMSVTCAVTEPDGDAVTVTVTVTWDGKDPRVTSQAFPPGATSSLNGAVVLSSTTAPDVAGGAPHATAECLAVNSRGQTVRRTIGIPK